MTVDITLRFVPSKRTVRTATWRLFGDDAAGDDRADLLTRLATTLRGDGEGRTKRVESEGGPEGWSRRTGGGNSGTEREEGGRTTD
jgi:hypothetical protein